MFVSGDCFTVLLDFNEGKVIAAAAVAAVAAAAASADPAAIQHLLPSSGDSHQHAHQPVSRVPRCCCCIALALLVSAISNALLLLLLLLLMPTSGWQLGVARRLRCNRTTGSSSSSCSIELCICRCLKWRHYLEGT
jgi:hypothetical protein